MRRLLVYARRLMLRVPSKRFYGSLADYRLVETKSELWLSYCGAFSLYKMRNMLWRHKRKDKAHSSFEDRSWTDCQDNFATNPKVRRKNQGQNALQLRDEKKKKWKMCLFRKRPLHSLLFAATNLQVLSIWTQNFTQPKVQVSFYGRVPGHKQGPNVEWRLFQKNVSIGTR